MNCSFVSSPWVCVRTRQLGLWWYFRSSSRFWPLSRSVWMCCVCRQFSMHIALFFLSHYFFCSPIHGLHSEKFPFPSACNLRYLCAHVYAATTTRHWLGRCFRVDFGVSVLVLDGVHVVCVQLMVVQLHAIQWLNRLIVSSAWTCDSLEYMVCFVWCHCQGVAWAKSIILY